MPYSSDVPKLWSDTIEEHRRTVHQAIVDTTWALATERGLLGVTMSEIADRVGIGRATLYKYFPDVETILLTGHQLHVAAHLKQLATLRDGDGAAGQRLEAVLGAYALIAHHRERHGTDELAAVLHRGHHVTQAQQELIDMFRDLLSEAAEAEWLRDDVAPEELARYCLHALSAASNLPDEAAVHRLVLVTLAGLRSSS